MALGAGQAVCTVREAAGLAADITVSLDHNRLPQCGPISWTLAGQSQEAESHPPAQVCVCGGDWGEQKGVEKGIGQATQEKLRATQEYGPQHSWALEGLGLKNLRDLGPSWGLLHSTLQGGASCTRPVSVPPQLSSHTSVVASELTCNPLLWLSMHIP